MTEGWQERVAKVVGGVVRQAVEDAKADGLLILEPDSPEAGLVVAWSVPMLGAERVWRVDPEPPGGEAARTPLRREELRRAVGRVTARDRNALLVHPVNRTALLLEPMLPPEPLLPLGDLPASYVERCAGGWTGSDALRALADHAGGVVALDTALERLVDQRLPSERALADLPEAARRDILERWEAGRFWRRRVGLVPKLGTRTLGIDLFD